MLVSFRTAFINLHHWTYFLDLRVKLHELFGSNAKFHAPYGLWVTIHVTLGLRANLQVLLNTQ
jgi:hypothetical protein